MTHYSKADLVIVGASLGGLRTAESARRHGFDGTISIIGEEPHFPYNRPPISKSALSQGELAETLAFPLRDSLGEIDWKIGETAVAADFDGLSIELSSGTGLHFKQLVIATGRRPRRLPITGADAFRHVVYTIDDAQRLRQETAHGERVVIVGGGFIGCEVAASLINRGCSVTVICSDELPLLRPLGSALASIVTSRHRAEGVVIKTSTRVVGFRQGPACPVAVLLNDGSSIDADVIVEAIGSEPSLDWTRGNDVKISDGIETDAWLRVVRAREGVFPSVFAVGDVARFPHPLAAERTVVIPHWSTPGDTARVAGLAIGSGQITEESLTIPPFAAMPTFWSDQYDWHILSYGLTSGAETTKVLDGRLGEDVIVGYFRKNTLIGLVGIGLRSSLMGMRELVGVASLE